MKTIWKKVKRWVEVTFCKHEWVETYHFEPDSKYRCICTKCGEQR